MGHPPQVPLTPQTDERNFPRWDADAPVGQSGHPFPKMLIRICTRDDRIEWLAKHKKRDQTTKEEYYEEAPPTVGSPIPVMATQDLVDQGLLRTAGVPVIMLDKEHEKLVREALGLPHVPEIKPRSVGIPMAGRSVEDLLAENAALRSALSVKPKPAPKRKRGPNKAKASHAIEEAIED
jgi:hypothetical protein